MTFDLQRQALPVYRDMVKAISSYDQGDLKSCATFVQQISDQLRTVFSSYLQTVHDDKIALRAWLTHVQGFAAWGVGHMDANSGEWVKFDGQSGNQALLFQALDAFLGLPVYLSDADRMRTVPALQRAFCDALARHSFRRQLDVYYSGRDSEVQMCKTFDEIIKRLKVQ